jgi:hypothetical protein
MLVGAADLQQHAQQRMVEELRLAEVDALLRKLGSESTPFLFKVATSAEARTV